MPIRGLFDQRADGFQGVQYFIGGGAVKWDVRREQDRLTVAGQGLLEGHVGLKVIEFRGEVEYQLLRRRCLLRLHDQCRFTGEVGISADLAPPGEMGQQDTEQSHSSTR
jgi:hypothetical protein